MKIWATLLFLCCNLIAGISQESAWEFLGPDSFPAFSGNGPCPNGLGLVSALYVDPMQPKLIFAASNTGGLFKSIDGGAHWKNVTDASMPMVVGVGSIVRDPLNPSRYYLGSGNSSYDREYGMGIWYSDDYGDHWNPSGLRFNPMKKDGFRASVKKILINPVNTDILYALVKSSADARIYKSTDGGLNWELILQEEGEFFFDAELDIADPEMIYVGGRKFYRSGDGGRTWRQSIMDAPHGEVIHRVAVSVHQSYPGVIWALYETGGKRGHVLAKSQDHGNTWRTVSTHSQANLSTGQWKMEFAVSPNDTNVFYAGGIYMHRSVDGGKSFNRISANRIHQKNWMHVDVRSMLVFQGSLADIIYAGHDGGVSISEDGGDSWRDISGEGLAITQFWGISCDWNNNRTYGGTQDLGLLVYDGKAWENQAIYGDVYDGLISQQADTAVVLVNSGRPGMRRTEDAGKTWKHVKQPFTLAKNDRPIAANPDEPEIIYVGYHDLHISNDFGLSWDRLSDFSREFGVAGHERLSALAVAPSDGKVIYTAYGEPAWSNEPVGQIFRSLNGGKSWQDISSALVGVRWAGITDIAVNPDDPFELWVAVNGFWIQDDGSVHKVYRSRDGGESWENVSYGLPNLPVNCLLFLPKHKKVLAGTDAGVYISSERANGWKEWNTGLPLTIIADLECNPENTIVQAASFGRGLYQTTLPYIEVKTPSKKGFFHRIFGGKE